MPYNKIQIVNASLVKLGYDQSTGTNLKLEQAASRSFDLNYPADIVASGWDFATKLASLTRNTDIPIIKQWQYIYELPSDCLKLIQLYPQANYDLIGNKMLYTNASILTAKYVFLPDPSQLPEYYIKYLINEIAKDLSESVMENAALADRFELQANKYRKRAQSTNAQSKPNEIWRNSRYIGDRY